MHSIKKTPSKAVVTLVWFLGLVAAWEIGAFIVGATKRTPENVLPHIYQIIYSFFDGNPVSSGQTVSQIVFTSGLQTITRAIEGFLIGMALGFGLALVMKLSHIVEKVAFPYLMIIQMIPILGLAPIILSLTHDIDVSRIVIAAILTFYPVATNTLAGFKAVEKEKYDLMHICAANKLQLYTKTLIPACKPYFFTGLKVAAPMAITASILVDTLQGDGGLGCMLSQSLKHAMSIYVFWDIVVFSAAIGIFSFYLMGIIENILSPNKRAAGKKR